VASLFQGLTLSLGRFHIALFACRALLLLYWLIFRVLWNGWSLGIGLVHRRRDDWVDSGRTGVVNCDRLPAGL